MRGGRSGPDGRSSGAAPRGTARPSPIREYSWPLAPAAALGAQVGCGLRPLILCGDGAFQMTGLEVSHAPAFGANPIVVVVNNGGWQIFRPVTDRADLLSIPPWPYAKLAEDWGGLGVCVERLSELRPALDLAHRNRRQFALIEVRAASDDLSPVTLKYIKAAGTHARPRAESSARSRY